MPTRSNKSSRKLRLKPKGRSSRNHRTKTYAISDRTFEAKRKAFDVIAKMRGDNKLSLVNAARDVKTSPATVRKYLPAALHKSRTGKWIATKSDRYTRSISLPGLHGDVVVKARGWKEAQLASEYLTALKRWSLLPKYFNLAEFHGKKIGGYELITAPRTLRALDEAGLLQLDSLYVAVKDAR